MSTKGATVGPEERLMAHITKLITDQEIPPDVVMLALLPLAAHATRTCGFSKEDFMVTAELTWDGIEKRFGGSVGEGRGKG